MLELTEEILKAKETLMRESKEGGELKDLPCPMCGLPRSQRSDYVRCTPCATNWLDGEDLTKNPRIERYNKMVSEQRSAKLKPADERDIALSKMEK